MSSPCLRLVFVLSSSCLCLVFVLSSSCLHLVFVSSLSHFCLVFISSSSSSSLPDIRIQDIDPNIPGHGPQTGQCVPTEDGNHTVCEIYSWCPVEDDHLLLGTEKPLISGSENHTVLIKNSIKFSYFGEQFHRNNMPDNICVFNFTDLNTRRCNIFKLGGNTDVIIFIIYQIL